MSRRATSKRFLSVRMIIAVILLLIFCSVEFLFLRLTEIPVNIALVDVVILFAIGVFFAYLIAAIQRNYHSSEVLNVPNLGTIALFGLMTALFSHIISINIFSDESAYIEFLDYTALVRALIILLIYTILLIIFWMEQQQIRSIRMQQDAVERERERNRIELNSLQQQFKPHFLFNSLNSIHALLKSDQSEAENMLLLLSDFMRNSLNAGDKFLPLKEEIELIRKYVRIEQVRFGERLQFIIDIDKDCEQKQIPTFLMQPLIENAIKYGLYGTIDIVTINLKAFEQKGDLVIEISNPIDGDNAASKGTGFGLSSVKKKLLILYGRSDLLKTEQSPDHFKVELIIPQHEKGNNN